MRILQGFCPVIEQAAVLSPDIPKGLAAISPNAHSQTDERTSSEKCRSFSPPQSLFPSMLSVMAVFGVLINPEPLHHLSFTPTYDKKTHFQTCLGMSRMGSTHSTQTASDKNVQNTLLTPLMQKDTHEVYPEMS